MLFSGLSLKKDYKETITTDFSNKIARRKLTVGVVGVGYVGRELVETTTENGFRTIGFDLDQSKLSQVRHKLFSPADSIHELTTCDAICICVPTPINEERKPDLGALLSAVSDVSSLTVTKEQLIIVESTVAPGTLRNIVLPVFLEKGRLLGKDFYLANSPERVDPGNKLYGLKNTPRIVGGVDDSSTKLAVDFYSSFVDKIIAVTSAEVAEMTKMLENTFRLVNISLINELSGYAQSIGIDMWEVVNAAASKPYAFMPHYPSAGVGGHCIPVDPYYLMQDAQDHGIDLHILKHALAINEERPRQVVEKGFELLNGKSKQFPNILLIGLSYKKGSSDTRESAATKIWKIAESMGARVSYHDPYVPKLNGWNSKPLTKQILSETDLIIITTDHEEIPWDIIAESGKPVLDTRNIYNGNGGFNIHKI